jgi:hypothetical protein
LLLLLDVELASDGHDIMQVPGQVLVIIKVSVISQLPVAGAPQDMVHAVNVPFTAVTLPQLFHILFFLAAKQALHSRI